MQLEEAKAKFINQWGSLGSKWGINRTMAQIHALFLTATDPLSAEEVMETLKISRGNANMNIRTLIDWGLVYKEHKLGERKEFFTGEKDIWKVAQRVIKIRQRQELDPIVQVLTEIQSVESTAKNEDEVLQFTNQIESIKSLAELADTSLTKISNSNQGWFVRTFMKLFK
ncbi:MAG: GbsR/MarR family transcriptional regulator [Salibacteraceae bacterium]